MIIRPATSEDIPQMLVNGETFTKAAYPNIPYHAPSFNNCITQMRNDKLLLIAEEDGIHLGGVGAVRGPLFINESLFAASERFWWVKPDKRAGGVGKALLAAIELAAAQARCDFLCMIALHNTDLPLVDGFYKAFGHSPSEHIYMKALTWA